MKTVRFSNAKEMLELYKLGDMYKLDGLKDSIVDLIMTHELSDAANMFFAYSFLNEDKKLRDIFQPMFNRSMAMGVSRYMSSTQKLYN